MPSTALITGASSGIGAALARCFAAGGHELILVARQRERLEGLATELGQRHQVCCVALPGDLSDPATPQRIYDEVRARGLAVGVLVNNAGLGHHGGFAALPLEQHRMLLQVNIASAIELTWLFLQDFLKARHGQVLNVASTAAFVPGPGVANYYASKAYVASWSLALAHEVRNRGVTVTTLCPGSTKTEFFDRAGMAQVRLNRSRWVRQMSAEAVARAGYDGLMAGKRLVVPGLFNKLVVWSARRSPLCLVTRLAAALNREVE